MMFQKLYFDSMQWMGKKKIKLLLDLTQLIFFLKHLIRLIQN